MPIARWVAGSIALCAVGAGFWLARNDGSKPIEWNARFRSQAEPLDATDNRLTDAGADAAPGFDASTRENALFFRATLEKGIQGLDQFAGYTALFRKQERIRGNVKEEELIDIKVRHHPFSAYMKWRDESQEVLYVDGLQDNRVVVRMQGVKGLLGTMRLDPSSSLALWKSRHPVTELGLMNLAMRLIAQCDRDLKAGARYTFRRLPNSKVGGRDCYAFVCEYQNQELEPSYRKSLLWVDRELQLVTAMQNFEWPADPAKLESAAIAEHELDAETFVESYSFEDIRMKSSFDPNDFDAGNEAYAFGL